MPDEKKDGARAGRRQPPGEDGGWRMEDGGWRMEDGGGRMEDGGWRMEDGGWRMEDGGFSTHDSALGAQDSVLTTQDPGPAATLYIRMVSAARQEIGGLKDVSIANAGGGRLRGWPSAKQP